MNGRIAITGASGFVGGHLLRAARADGWQVAGIVRSEAAAQAVRAAGGEPFRALEAGLAGAAVAVHLAQIGSERGGETYEAVNVEGTHRLIAAARAAGVRRIVYFSGLGVAHYGLRRRCTNRYFLSKLACEVALFRSRLEVVVFRPSYVVGPGDGFIRGRLQEIASGEVECPGDGSFRLQPVAVGDAVALVLAAARRAATPVVFDLVGPEAVTYRQLLERLARFAKRSLQVREVPIDEVDRRAAAGGFHGMGPDTVDCLLCDEISNPRPLEALLGRPLTPLDEALAPAAGSA